MALIDIQCNITEATNNRNYSIGIFFDLAKAFDTVDNSILNAKLWSYGITGVAINWFLNNLTDGTQFVSFKNSLSSSNGLKCAVPRGSILGPLLF